MNATGRIVITGMGVVSPIGIGVEAFHRALAEGKSGISVMEFPWQTGYKVLRAGQVKDSELRVFHSDAPKMGRASELALAASKLALEEAGLDFPPRQANLPNKIAGNLRVPRP